MKARISMLAVLASLGAVADARAATYVVTETGDAADVSAGNDFCDSDFAPGLQCTLRAAIEEANSDPDQDSIQFAIPGGGVQKIKTASALPNVTQQVDIDGYTQPGSSPNTKDFGEPLDTKLRVEVSGSGLIFSGGSASSDIRGLAISRPMTGSGIFNMGSAVVTVQGCFIGTDAKGKKARPGASQGFLGQGVGNLIGGQDPEDRNLISGNVSAGVAINSSSVVVGNYIGTAADGKSPLPNGLEGVFIGFGGSLVEENVIAFNRGDGISVPNEGDSLFSQNHVFRNRRTAIDLDNDGVTPNDPGDADTGPNSLQNYPVIKSARANANADVTVLRVKLNSTPLTTFRLEFFESKRKKRDAQDFLSVVPAFGTDAEGKASEEFTTFRAVKEGRRITATATDIEAGTLGATSELSKPVVVK